jgi:L-serine/L-threonine ammonia-lyase
MALHIATPLLRSEAFDTREGQRVWLKMEALQPSGSFKLRGIGHACEVHAAAGTRRIVPSSGGNAGLAAAHAARRLGLPALVVVPETTSARARALLARAGAEVRVHGLSFQEANAHAQSRLGPQDAFIHPFDDPLLWEGHAGMIDEVAHAGLRPDAVVLCYQKRAHKCAAFSSCPEPSC